jgi:hypothetical protein
MPITLNGTQLAKRFNEAFEYRDGKLYWAVSNTNAIRIGQEAGTEHSRGYRRVMFEGKQWAVHRIIWTMFNGDIPSDMQVDHINGDASDNKIENLRLASNADNCKNRKVKPSNTGIRNVSLCKATGKYKVAVQADNKKIHLGHFDDLEFAELVAIEARAKYHGEFARI